MGSVSASLALLLEPLDPSGSDSSSLVSGETIRRLLALGFSFALPRQSILLRFYRIFPF